MIKYICMDISRCYSSVFSVGMNFVSSVVLCVPFGVCSLVCLVSFVVCRVWCASSVECRFLCVNEIQRQPLENNRKSARQQQDLPKTRVGTMRVSSPLRF